MQCTLCHRAFASKCHWYGPGMRHVQAPDMCDQSTCMACGTEQCHGNGSGRGTCRECHYGMLPGWSGSSERRACDYKGCAEPAVYVYLPGSKSTCCLAHGRGILERRANKKGK